jgi:formylglycine-generating enzyme required for sulfatase activity
MGRSQTTKDDATKMRPQILLDDRPVHKVKISAFQLDAKETTHELYEQFVKATGHRKPYHWLNGQVPEGMAKIAIYNVDWNDAKSYCEWKGGRLPTEAEWEYAARGGHEQKPYPWGDKPDAKAARYATEAGPGEPGKYPPNAYGLFDMSGNMAEWTADWFEREYYKQSPTENPKGPETGQYKIIRGGAWSDPASRLTTFFRNWVRPNQRSANIGFRCVTSSPPAAAAQKLP